MQVVIISLTCVVEDLISHAHLALSNISGNFSSRDNMYMAI